MFNVPIKPRWAKAELWSSPELVPEAQQRRYLLLDLWLAAGTMAYLIVVFAKQVIVSPKILC